MRPMGPIDQRVILYVRVSTEEQAKTGLSLADQVRELTAHAEAKDLTVVEVVRDEGYSGASPDRPGLARVMELAEAGAAGAVVATKRDRFFRSRLYRLLLERDLKEHGVRLVALNDVGHRIGDGLLDDFAEWEREQITARTMAGKLQKAREGKIVAGRLPVYGFRYTADRNHYEVDEARMVAVRRLFELAAEGRSVHAVARTLDAEGFPAPSANRWQRPTVREVVLDDTYYPFSREEVARLVTPQVAEVLAAETYGVWWYNRREAVKTSRGKRIRKKPREEWIAVPVPDAGVPRHVADEARRLFLSHEKLSAASGGAREWELSRGVGRCDECGCALVAHQSTWHKPLKDGTKRTLVRFYYRCATYRKRGRGEGGCSMSRNYRADKMEAKIWEVVRGMMLDPASVEEALARGRRERKKRTRKAPDRLPAVMKALAERERRRDGFLELAADGLMPKPELVAKLGPLDAEISALRGEADAIAGAARREASDEAGARAALGEMGRLPAELLDEMTPDERRGVYAALQLRVWAKADGSFRLTWLAGADLAETAWEEEEKRWQSGRTSTR